MAITFPEVKIENVLTGTQYMATLTSSSGYTAYYEVDNVPMPANPRESEFVFSDDKIYEFWIYLNGIKYPKSAYVTVLGDKDDLSDLEFRVTKFESENPVLPPEGGNAHFVIEISAAPGSTEPKSQQPTVDNTSLAVGSNELRGTGIPTGSINVKLNDTIVGTVTVPGSGQWTTPLSSVLVIGDNIEVTQTHGDLPASTALKFTVA